MTCNRAMTEHLSVYERDETLCKQSKTATIGSIRGAQSIIKFKELSVKFIKV